MQSLKSIFRLFKNKYFFKLEGDNVRISRTARIKRSKGLVLGNNINIKSNTYIDATAGILIGDNSKINNGVSISTRKNNNSLDWKSYQPVIIGAGNDVRKNVEPGTYLAPKVPINGLANYQGQLVFVVSTGRSGTHAISSVFNTHPDAVCYHDTFPHIYNLACEKIYNHAPRGVITESLDRLYNATSFTSRKVFCQSDQKLAALIPELAQLYPHSKFIWLIRDAKSFINSAYPRGWYSNKEIGITEKNDDEFFARQAEPSTFDAAHRICGFKSGSVSKTEWINMTAFERNCWYWSYWNNKIEENLNLLPISRRMTIRLDEISNKYTELYSFCGLKPFYSDISKTNQATYKKLTSEDWTSEMERICNKWCGDLMLKWFDR